MGDPALAIAYKCTVDGLIPLGIWSKIEGLSLEYDVFEYKEGGVNNYTHKLIGPVKYGNVRLSRPVDSNSALVQMWIQSSLLKVVKHSMSIEACNAAGETITSWSLIGVVPLKWSGPSLDVFGNQIATETIEIAFQEILGLGALGDLLGGLGVSASVGF